MSAAVSLDAPGVRPVKLPTTAAERVALAARMNRAIDAAEAQGGDRGAIGCARLLAALVEHMPRYYPVINLADERALREAARGPSRVARPAPAVVVDPAAEAAEAAALADDVEAHHRRLATAAEQRRARAERLMDRVRLGAEVPEGVATLVADLRAARALARAELDASRARLDEAEAAAGTMADRLEALRREVATLRRRVGQIEGGKVPPRPDGKAATVAQVTAVAARYFGVDLAHVRPARSTDAPRYADSVAARHVAMWVLAHRTNALPMSGAEIGRRLGGFDHTTVVHALRRVDADVARGGRLAVAAAAIAAAAGVELDVAVPAGAAESLEGRP